MGEIDSRSAVLLSSPPEMGERGEKKEEARRKGEINKSLFIQRERERERERERVYYAKTLTICRKGPIPGNLPIMCH